MKTSVLAAAALGIAGAAGAAPIHWAAGPDFGGAQGQQGILKNGTLVQAVHLAGSNGGSIVVDPGGLDMTFQNIDSSWFNSSFTDLPNNIGDSGWSSVIRTFEWGGSGDVDAASFLGGLTVGERYRVQFFSGRSNGCCADRTLKIGDGLGHFSTPISQAPMAFQSVVGTFVADAGTQRVVFDDSANAPVLSAYVLLQSPTPPVPEPQSGALKLGGLALTLGRLARRRC